MNNKGFAITSVIYGLAILGLMIVVILMGTLSATRKNVSEQAQEVERFLINFTQTEVTYHSGGTYVVPSGESGWYRIEAFGKGNGTRKGAYATGILYANEGDSFSVVIDTDQSALLKGTFKLISAGAATSNRIGGALSCYGSAPTGGVINMTNYRLKTATASLTGIDSVNFADTTCKKSFISGYPQSGGYNGSGTTNSVNYLVDGLILAGASGDSKGKVLITRLGEKESGIVDVPVKNSYFNNVTKIEVSGDYSSYISKIYYTYHIVSGNAFKSYQKACNNPCTVSLPAASSFATGVTPHIDEISIFFKTANVPEKTVLRRTTVKLTSNGTLRTVYDSNDIYGITLGPNGLHLSAYQPLTTGGDYTNAAEFALHGNYYILPVVADNRAVSAVSNATDDANQLKIEALTGESRQKWSIDMINVPGSAASPDFPNIPNVSGKREYRIMELTRYKALNIYYDENYKMNFVSASETFNSLSRNEPQIWNIYPMRDTSYAIKTVVPSFTVSEKSGFLFAKPAGDGPNNINDIMIGLVQSQSANDNNTLPTNVERFFLYSLDFSS